MTCVKLSLTRTYSTVLVTRDLEGILRNAGNTGWVLSWQGHMTQRLLSVQKHLSLKAKSHVPCRAPTALCPHVAGTIRTANRETPRGSWKTPDLGRSPMPCPYRAVPVQGQVACKAAWSDHGMGTAWCV